MSRGDQGDEILLRCRDRQHFLKPLAEACWKIGWPVQAHSLTRKHYQLVLETPEPVVAGTARLAEHLQTCLRFQSSHWNGAVAQAASPASSGSVSLPFGKRGETPLEPAAGTAALRHYRDGVVVLGGRHRVYIPRRKAEGTSTPGGRVLGYYLEEKDQTLLPRGRLYRQEDRLVDLAEHRMRFAGEGDMERLSLHGATAATESSMPESKSGT